MGTRDTRESYMCSWWRNRRREHISLPTQKVWSIMLTDLFLDSYLDFDSSRVWFRPYEACVHHPHLLPSKKSRRTQWKWWKKKSEINYIGSSVHMKKKKRRKQRKTGTWYRNVRSRYTLESPFNRFKHNDKSSRDSKSATTHWFGGWRYRSHPRQK